MQSASMNECYPLTPRPCLCKQFSNTSTPRLVFPSDFSHVSRSSITTAELRIDSLLLSFGCSEGVCFSGYTSPVVTWAPQLFGASVCTLVEVQASFSPSFWEHCTGLQAITFFIIQLLSINITGVLQKFAGCSGRPWNGSSYTALLIILRCSPQRLSALCSTHVHKKQACFFVFSLILQRLFKFLFCFVFSFLPSLPAPWLKLLWEMQPRHPSHFMSEMRKATPSEK